MHRAIWFSLNIVPQAEVNGVTVYKWDFGYAMLAVKAAGVNSWTTREAEFETKDQFFTLIDQWSHAKTKTYLICQDSNKILSLLDIFTEMQSREWSLTLAVIDCPPMICRWRKLKKTVLAFDMWNIWPQPLTATCRGEKIAASSEPNDAYAPLPTRNAVKERVKVMMTQTQEWWNFLIKHDLGGFSPTIGAQSVRVWRHKYMQESVLIDCHDDALALARKAIYGGRNECGWIGTFEGTFHQVDINSSYAATMCSMLVPARLVGHTKSCTVSDLREWVLSSVTVADVTVRTTSAMFPMRSPNGIIFPVGKFRTVLAGDELRRAIANGNVLGVHEAAIYSGRHAFRWYMTDLWRRRMEARDSGDERNAGKWKMLMASFFGKWCQNGGRWENIGKTNEIAIRSWVDVDLVDRVVREYRQFGGVVQLRSIEKESAESSPAIAACITAGARMQLWDLMTEAGLEHVYYVDTDSLLLDNVGFGRLAKYVDVRELGALKVVGEYDNIQIIAAKNYRVGRIIHVSGRKADAIQFDANSVYQSHEPRFAAQVHYNRKDQAETRTQKKTWTPTYKKGVVSADGRVRPIQLEMEKAKCASTSN